MFALAQTTTHGSVIHPKKQFQQCLLNLCSSHLQVKALKEKIENEKGNDGFPVAGQKLIYAGTVSAPLPCELCNVFVFVVVAIYSLDYQTDTM